jgi:ATP-dependent DNA helicase RecG
MHAMTPQEFQVILNDIRRLKCETQTLEIKKAKDGAPTRLYDTLSSFSNQDDGGIIIFGIDESNRYQEMGVNDAQDLQKKISEQCKEMEPAVRPLLGAFEVDSHVFVTAEIPGMDISRRPCFYKGKGRLKGSYIRVGDSDEPMTEYEIYSYEAYRERHQDDIRVVSRALPNLMDQDAIQNYMNIMKRERVNFSRLPEQEITELTNLTRQGQYTLAAVMVFGIYPQSFFPQLCITAVRIPGTQIGEVGSEGERFLDNRRLEGSIRNMFDEAMMFIQANMKVKTIINSQTGHREDRTEYPVSAVREAILNALAHRDYSRYSEGMPIQILMFADRMEVHNPGGLYGRLRIDQLGKVQPDTRNPVLVSLMETMRLTENRYSGIPTIRREMKAAGLPEPEFVAERGNFVVKFYNSSEKMPELNRPPHELSDAEIDLLKFCQTPRTRQEIAEFLQVATVWYAITRHVTPLVERGLIELSMPHKPGSPRQTYHSTISLA